MNPERRSRTRALQFGPQAQACRESACMVCGCSPCDPHHEPSVGAGGLDHDTTPLCRRHHDERHTMPLADFNARHGVDVLAIVLEMRQAVTSASVGAPY